MMRLPLQLVSERRALALGHLVSALALPTLVSGCAMSMDTADELSYGGSSSINVVASARPSASPGAVATNTGFTDAADAGGAADAADAADSAAEASDAGLHTDGAAPAVVPGVQFVGVVPSPVLVLDAGAVVPGSNEFGAEFEVLALGSRARWFEIMPDSALGLSLLEQNKDVYREAGVRLLVNLPLRDVLSDLARSSADADALSATYQMLLDSIFKGPVIPDYITFGSALDVSMAALTETELGALEAWLLPLLDYVHDTKPDAVHFGLSGSANGWLAPSPAFADLATNGDIAAASWLVVSAQGQAVPPAPAVRAFDDLVAAVDATGLQLVLQDLSYPSSPEVLSSEEQQDAFFAAFFERLAHYPEQVPFVSVSALNEFGEPACAAYAKAFALPELAAVARCSVGLRGRDSMPKPAYQTVAEGFARFSTL